MGRREGKDTSLLPSSHLLRTHVSRAFLVKPTRGRVSCSGLTLWASGLD